METAEPSADGLEVTLALIKPDAVAAGKAAEMQQLAEMSGFTILAKCQLRLTPQQAEEFYAEHRGKAFFNGLVEFMTQGPLVALALAKPDAVRAWRQLMGPTNVFDARQLAPRSLRALYGSDGTRNAAHGSDSPASARREVKFFFPTLQPATAAQDAAAAQEYIASKLQPVLVKALTSLARQKPTSDRLEAVTFLARWLRDNNPNKPALQVPEELAQQLAQQQAAAKATAAAVAAAVSPQAVEASAGGGEGAASGLAPPRAASQAAGPPPDARALEDEAATKVQAAFRGHRVRRQVATGVRAGQVAGPGEEDSG